MNALAQLPARRILRAIADAVERWSDADFPPRVRVLDGIVERTGYTLPAVEYALDRLFESLTADALEATIAGELGSIDVLDRFIARPGRPGARAVAAGSACVISSRTTIGVAIVPAVFALCAKCPVVVKDREDALVGAFFSTLAQEDDAFAECARAEMWDGASSARDLASFATVVAFGRDDTLTRIRAQCAPEARFVGFGSKASAGYVTREALADEAAARAIAQGAARDLVLYESEGCLSLHVLFAERGATVTTQRFAEMVAGEVERIVVEFPLGQRTVRAKASLASARALAAFRSAGGGGQVYSDERASHLIVADDATVQAPYFLPRALGIHAVNGPDDAAAYLASHGVTLEAIASPPGRADVTAMAVASGAARIARFGELQSPPASGNHGGRARVSDFVRWITDER
jgi:hypothetical protein